MFGLWMVSHLTEMHRPQRVVIFAGERQVERKSMRFIKPLLQQVVKITVRQGCALTTTPITTVRS